ncbi:DNA-directed RNA polymerase I subunit RPA1-like [Antedon mediterranea]|uniref:DNA-directed RNA polymerase I subunit RPA1-like n=1 Tax=Antedon mediterranea TaxID=105859 RepID=UPI003AF5BFF6
MSGFMQQIPSKRPCNIQFRTYSSKEILELSVKEIVNPKTFDDLGHPTAGGLHDLSLGPSHERELCATCYLGYLHCPGHMAHIRLPLPVFNPMYFKNILQLLRGSCLQCHHLLAPRWSLVLISYQLECLDKGFFHAVDEMQNRVNSLAMDNSGNDPATVHLIESTLKDYMEELESEKENQFETVNTNLRNLVAIRKNLVDTFMKEHINSHGRKCALCGTTVRQIRPEHNVRIITKQLRSDSSNLEQVFLSPSEARDHLRKISAYEDKVFKNLFGVLKGGHFENSTTGESAIDLFFLEVIPVIPTKFRPVSAMGDKRFENPQTGGLTRVLKDSQTLSQLLFFSQNEHNEEFLKDFDKSILAMVPGKSNTEKLQNSWSVLQTHVNSLIDSDMDKLSTENFPGVKQILEKKEGLFRKHMMGKRVNYAARSVISPDPFINSDEIGIPDIIAKKLTYPQPVTEWNAQELRRAIMNGPNKHPGALLIENEDGTQMKLKADNVTQREAIAKQLLTPQNPRHAITGQKRVHRHIKNGDVLLLNRQPTLHKPSIMAHKVRILPREKTFRLHYSACKTYNADFDGDEMNAHFPQNEIGRSEAYNIASTSHQYLVPKDGTPLGGLIQDHMISGVKMTVRGRFYTKAQYQQLVFNAMTDKSGHVKLLRPAIIKPKQLWSGKQVFSTLLLNIIPENKPLFNFKGRSKISSRTWRKNDPRVPIGGGTPLKGDNMTESEVIFRQGQLLVGVLDKANYGSTPYGLVHACYELYGGQTAVLILSCLGRLFTTFLQFICGFSLGVEDIIVKTKADKKRKKMMKKAVKSGLGIMAKTLQVEDPKNVDEIIDKYESAHRSSDGLQMAEIDMQMKTNTEAFTTEISNVCLGQGLIKSFPNNSLQLMVQSGAKGSMVNCMQISCLLGQIELEGRRPPLMLSGRSLPSFQPYDSSPRSGGYVDGRFLTGIRPQEYFFHCMAGREGLVDTAVKTSRSGYLQRCIIKHLEGLVVNYDLTVRDSDGSIVQFNYGEDSLDISKTPYLNPTQYDFLIENSEVILGKNDTHLQNPKKAVRYQKKIKKWKENKNTVRISPFLEFISGTMQNMGETAPENKDIIKDELIDLWRTVEDKEQYSKNCKKCPDPVLTKLRPDTNFGSISEKLDQLVKDYLDVNIRKFIKSETDCKEPNIDSEGFKKLMYSKYQRSLCEPGEAVGLLAAQSIGEPSTQMTLNTFHFAGKSEMNVTLGIPRLREILIVASANIKTPSMDVPFHSTRYAHKRAARLRKKLMRVHLSQIIEDVNIYESYDIRNNWDQYRVYKIRFNFLPQKEYEEDCYASPATVLEFFEKHFVKQLTDTLKKRCKELKRTREVNFRSVGSKFAMEDAAVGERGNLNGSHSEEPTEADDHEQKEETDKSEKKDDGESDDEGDGDAADRKYQGQKDEEKEYDEEDENVDSGNEDAFVESAVSEGEHSQQEGEDEYMSDAVMRKSMQKKKTTMEEKDARINAVVCTSSLVSSYKFDKVDHLWCELVLKFELHDSKLDLGTIILNEAKRAVVYETAGISRCFINDEDGEKRMKTEGVNFKELFKFDRILNMNKLYSNDIHAVARTYGIEAACRVIVKEMRDVFKVYGITVDPRHLSLIADYMTFEGVYMPFNRTGLETNASPLQKMTFESTMHFLKEATIHGVTDQLKSPSARLVVGRVVSSGTGCFDLLQQLT